MATFGKMHRNCCSLLPEHINVAADPAASGLFRARLSSFQHQAHAAAQQVTEGPSALGQAEGLCLHRNPIWSDRSIDPTILLKFCVEQCTRNFQQWQKHVGTGGLGPETICQLQNVLVKWRTMKPSLFCFCIEACVICAHGSPIEAPPKLPLSVVSCETEWCWSALSWRVAVANCCCFCPPFWMLNHIGWARIAQLCLCQISAVKQHIFSNHMRMRSLWELWRCSWSCLTTCTCTCRSTNIASMHSSMTGVLCFGGNWWAHVCSWIADSEGLRARLEQSGHQTKMTFGSPIRTNKARRSMEHLNIGP